MTPPLPAPSGHRSPRLSRRSALGLATAGPLTVLLGACSRARAQDRLSDGVDRLRAPRRTPPAPANPDQAVVDAAVAAIAGLRSALLPHRDDAVVADLLRLHGVHLKALGVAPAAAGPGAAAPALEDGPVRAAALAREQVLARTLATQAGSAKDGELARLLASMSAAVAQRVAGGAA